VTCEKVYGFEFFDRKKVKGRVEGVNQVIRVLPWACTLIRHVALTCRHYNKFQTKQMELAVQMKQRRNRPRHVFKSKTEGNGS